MGKEVCDMNAGADGFAFGFQSELPDEKAAVDGGSGAPFDKVQDKEEPKDNVYEQDKLEDIFKQSKGVSDINAGVGGFAFGFQSELPDEKAAVDGGSSAPFSFGFEPNITAKNDNDPGSPPQESLEKNTNDLEPKSVDTVQSSSTLKATEVPKFEPPQRKRRMGMRFPESDLDAYEEMFFSLNEGPQILKDLDAMKTDEESQERWQKERLVLTADWKRKQKSALSKKVKKV